MLCLVHDAQAHLLGADGILPLDQVQQMTAAYHEGQFCCLQAALFPVRWLPGESCMA